MSITSATSGPAPSGGTRSDPAGSCSEETRPAAAGRAVAAPAASGTGAPNVESPALDTNGRLPERLRPLVFVAAAIIAITLVRVGMLWAAPVPLAPDEAQYVGWSRALSGGYFSKPPLIAWVLAGAQAGCPIDVAPAGAALHAGVPGAIINEGCVRWWQPLAFALSAVMLWAIGRTLTGRHAVGAMAALVLVTMPALGFYSAFATTDAWLMLCWSMAWFAAIRASGEPGMLHAPGTSSDSIAAGHPVVPASSRAAHRWWALCGVACGLGMLTKYSMVLFGVALAVLLLWQGPRRSRGPWIAAGVAIVVASPNLVWNALEGFPTIAHHVEISEVSSGLHRGFGQRLASAGAFLASQFGVFGPLALVAALATTLQPMISRFRRPSGAARTPLPPTSSPVWRSAVVFGWLPVAAITVQALLSRAFANWAMPAAVGVALLASLWWMRPDRPDARRGWRGRAWRWSVGIGLFVNAVVLLGPIVWPHTPWAMERQRNPFLRLDGWREMAHLVAGQAQPQAAGAPIVAARERDLLATLTAYAWPVLPQVRAWNPGRRRSNHYEWFQDLADTEAIDRREVLLVGIVPRDAAPEAALDAEWGSRWRDAFDRVEPVDVPGLDRLWPGGRRENRFVVVRAHRFTGYR